MIRLGLKLLWRDWRGGELGLLLAALVLAVATVLAISLFVDRLQRALLAESAQVLGADVVISSGQEIPEEWRAAAAGLGLETARTLNFNSMVFAGEASQLVNAKAVSPTYPLRGRLIVAEEAFVRGTPAATGPQPGQVWLDSRLLPALGVRVGGTVSVGYLDLRVAKVLIAEPDRGSGFYGFGPRLMMHFDDLAATGVIAPGSRLTHKLLVAGPVPALDAMRARYEAADRTGLRWQGVRDGSASVASALERAESFLLLGGLLGVVLAGIAVALAAHRYSQRHADHVAVLKTLGLGPRAIRGIYLGLLVGLWLVGVLVGCVLGWAAHAGILGLLANLVPIELPPSGFEPYVVAAVTGLICLLAFALPPLLRLQSISPMRVVRGDLAGDEGSARIAYAAGAVGAITLMLWYSKSVWLTGLVLLGSASVAAVLLAGAWLLLRSGHVAGMQAGDAWRLAMGGLRRRGWQNSVQILIFALAIMLALVLLLLRTSIIEEWRGQLPEDTPNHFLMNVVPDQVDDVRAAIVAETGESITLFPMIRGNISAINGVTLAEFAAERRQREGRDGSEIDGGPGPGSTRNLTWTDELPAGNQITAGQWWPVGEARSLVSLDLDYAERVGVGLGDTLTFRIIDREVVATISNLRRVNWDSLQPNFYVLFSPGALNDLPTTYMTSFYLKPSQKRFLNTFLTQFPTVTVLEVDALIVQVRTIIDRVTLAIELVLALILASGALVMVAAVRASIDERVREQALVRTLGGSKRLILGALAAEFCALGAFAGLLAALGSELTVYTLQSQVFRLPTSFHPTLYVIGPAVGIALVATLGLLATRRVIDTPPVVVLREG